MEKCKKCGKDFIPQKGLKQYCSLKCRNSRNFTEESRKLKSKSALNSLKIIKKKQENVIIRENRKSTCIICGDEFKYKWNVKTCSAECYQYLLSILRQDYLMKNGTDNFKTKQYEFEYNGIKIRCDSKLEIAGIIYLKDIFQADCIERYSNILNFYIGELHKTFNPDFYVKKSNKIYIVEVKMKWINTSDHIYNFTIPLKKEALKKYCDGKGFNMIWLDFDYDIRFKEIYNDVLSNKYASIAEMD